MVAGSASCWAPDVPEGARLTAWWRAMQVIYNGMVILRVLPDIVGSLMMGEYFVGMAAFIWGLLYLALFNVIMYHIQYTSVAVTRDMINVEMGPMRWRCVSWCLSSQIRRREVVSITRAKRSCCWPDIFPHCMCAPVQWACCWKTYSGFWWPCCCTSESCGATDTSDMVRVHLTQSPYSCAPMCCKRCAPCPLQIAWLWCCVYNRIAFFLTDEQVWHDLQTNDYPINTVVDGIDLVVRGEKTEGLVTV